MSELLPRKFDGGGSNAPRTPEVPPTPPPMPEYLPGQPPTTVERALAAAAVTNEVTAPTFGDRLKDGFRHRGRILGVTSLAAAVIVGGGVALAHSSDKTEARQLPTASAPAVPGMATEPSTPSPELSETAQPSTEYLSPGEVEPASITDNELFDKLTPAQQAEIERDEAMDLDDFQKLEPEEQWRYGQFFYDVYEKFGETQIKKGLSRLNEYLPDVTPDVMNSSQQILAQTVKAKSVAKWSFTVNGDPYKIDNSKKLAAKKALSLVYVTTNEPSAYGNPYPAAIRSFEATDSLVPGTDSPDNDDGYVLPTALGPDQPVDNYYVPKGNDGTDPHDFSNPAKYLHAMANNQVTQRIFLFSKFTDVQGNDRSRWLFGQILDEDDQFAPLPAYRAPTN